MASKKKTAPDLSTEEKIKEAAKRLFTEKGYAATRTRDIAEASGINLALLNYYFRSKERLFEMVMIEKLRQFFGILQPVIYDETSTLETKVRSISANYIDLLLANPDLPLFIMTELRSRPGHFLSILPKDLLSGSSLARQISAARPDIHPVHFFINILGMTVFPFIARPVLQKLSGASDEQYYNMVSDRKAMIPGWVKAMLKAK